MTQKIKLNTDRFKELKDDHGVWTARKICLKEALIRSVNDATSVEDLKKVLITIIDEQF
jgi:hypothetical protein